MDRFKSVPEGHQIGMISFERESLVPLGALDTFDLALDIDAHSASMEASGERAIDGVTTGIIGLGETVTWRARHFGVTWTMTTRISESDPPNRFVDRQERGPFKEFVHEHTFVAVDGGTRVTDRVQFAAPLGVLGRLAERLVLKRYIPRLIDVRNEFMIAEAAERRR
jgi:ligand-binding SRPBCC domain-containing protein